MSFTGETKKKKIWFSGKFIILCILEGEMPFKMHKIIFFQEKIIIIIKKHVCLHHLNCSDKIPETHLFFFNLA